MAAKRTAAVHHSSTRPRSSADTRSRILAAARERFASAGYERTTIRLVAQDAEVDPAMVMRYFGSKDGLFAAASDFELRIPDLRDRPRAKIGEALVAHFFGRWEGGDDSLQILLRAAATNADAAARMRAIVRDQVGAMVARVRGKQASQRVAALIATQMLGLAYCRYVLRLPALLEMSPESLVRAIGATVQRYLDQGGRARAVGKMR
jgi:AcrR family transcriptional regulator